MKRILRFFRELCAPMVEENWAPEPASPKQMDSNDPICDACARQLGGVPVEYAVGVWADHCGVCGKDDLMRAVRDFVWANGRPSAQEGK